MQSDIFKKPFVHAILIVILGLLIYSNAYHVPFHFDDHPMIKQCESLPEHFSVSAFLKQNRAVGYLSFVLNYAVHGRSVLGYHVVNIAIHLINALLVYLLVVLSLRTSLLKDSVPNDRACAIALISSLLFVCHPVQTQAVTYIVQRYTSLAAMFYLLTFVLYIKARTSDSKGISLINYVLSLLSAMLAMKSKEIAFTLPFTIALYEMMFFSGKGWKRPVFLASFLLMLLIIPLGLFGVYGLSQDSIRDVEMATRVQTTLSRYSYLLTEFSVITTYLRLLILPVNQNLDYDYPIYHTLFDPVILVSLLLIMALISVAWRFRRSTGIFRLLSFGIFWFFITLSVESSFIPIEDVIFEHRIYLPSAGYFIAISVLLISGISQLGVVHKRLSVAATSILAALIIILSAATYARNTVWQSELEIWKDVTEKSPLKERGHYNLARQYRMKGNIVQAVAEYELAIACSRNAHDASESYNNLGRLYEEQGLLEKAEAAYIRSVEMNSANSIAFNNLGLVFMRNNLLDRAIAQFSRSIEIDPVYAKARANLVRALQEKGLYAEAEQELKKASEHGLDLRNMLNPKP